MKNKVVYFPPNGTARIFMTHNPDEFIENFKDGKVLVNPNLDLVIGIPHEFWTLDSEGQIIPLVGAKLEERMKFKSLEGLLTEKDTHVREEIHKLVDIPETLHAVCDKLEDRFDHNETIIQKSAFELRANLEKGLEFVVVQQVDYSENILKQLKSIEKSLDKELKLIKYMLTVLCVVILVFIVHKLSA